jgi:glucosyl-3-phosphoglycerate synthase
MKILQHQPANKIVAFDMDNTLLQKRFIDRCAEEYNFTQALALLRHLNNDPITLTIKIAAFLKDKTTSELINIAASIPLVEDTQEVVAALKKRNYIIGIISDSYQLIAQHVAQKIGADFWLANELQAEFGRVTGEVLIPSYFLHCDESGCNHQVCKTNALRHICKKYNSSFENCIVVGDSDNDICMVSHAGTGVAFCSTSELLNNAAARRIDQRSFKSILEYAV